MTRLFFYLLALPIGIVLGLDGCGTTGSPATGYDAGKPQIFLAGADVQHAKSLAMGSAVAKGWRIVDSSGNRLLVKRPLDDAAAESVTGKPVTMATVEVATEFHERRGGVDVVVSATISATTETGSEQKRYSTENYNDELNRSLDSLQRSWDQNRWRITSATPPLPAESAEPVARDSEGTPAEAPVAGAATEPAPGEGVATGWAEAPPPEPVSTVGPGNEGRQIQEPYADSTPAAASTAATDPAENMLVLNRTAEPGVWAYYAEHYAKIRGCDLAGSGAVLEDKQPELEIHRVHCKNGQDFLVKCNAGTCRGLK